MRSRCCSRHKFRCKLIWIIYYRWSGCNVMTDSPWTGFSVVEEITGERGAHTGTAYYVITTVDKATTWFKTAWLEVWVVCFSSSSVSAWSLITFDLWNVRNATLIDFTRAFTVLRDRVVIGCWLSSFLLSQLSKYLAFTKKKITFCYPMISILNQWAAWNSVKGCHYS